MYVFARAPNRASGQTTSAGTGVDMVYPTSWAILPQHIALTAG